MNIKVLAVGDVCGRGGMEFLSRHLRPLQRLKGVDFTVVNGENANVVGVTPAQVEDILDCGADVVTLGNHTWTRTEIGDYLDRSRRCLRPLNFSARCPGRGWGEFDAAFGKVLVINAIGRYALDSNTDNPFTAAERVIEGSDAKLVLVDFHAEATSEKRAMGFFLDGRASAVWGTHTHVQTSDACALPKGTGYITDLGMTGPVNSVLGIDPMQSVGKFLGEPPRRYSPASGPCKLEAALFELNTETGLCLSAEALRIE